MAITMHKYHGIMVVSCSITQPQLPVAVYGPFRSNSEAEMFIDDYLHSDFTYNHKVRCYGTPLNN